MEIVLRVPELINNHFKWKDSRQRSWKFVNKVLSLQVILLGFLTLCTATNSDYANQSFSHAEQEEKCPDDLNSTIVYVEFSSQIVKNGKNIYSESYQVCFA